jgi:two-component system sensor histidine kinase/response regulator
VITNRPVWQKDEALDRLEGDEDLLRELCQIFLEESPKLVEKLKRAVTESDPTAVMQAAHRLKGELGYVGAENACSVAKQLEALGRDRNLSTAAEMLSLLERELSELQFSIKHFAESSP